MLMWSWDECCGTATYSNGTNEYTLSLFVGNAYLIEIYEQTNPDGTEVHEVAGFYHDKKHLETMLDKQHKYKDNNLNTDYRRLLKIRLNKAKCKKAGEIAGVLASAFDNLTIEIYNEP